MYLIDSTGMNVTTRNTELEEQELAERAGAGDEPAFRTLFNRYGSKVFRFSLLMVGEKAAAEDIYQDTFIGFLKACRQGKKMYSVRGYLFTIARTRCLNYLETQRRRAELAPESETHYEFDLAVTDIQDHVRKALMKLPEHYREVLVLCEYDGYSYEEIAETLNISRHIVKNRIYRGKQMLRDILQPILNDDDSESIL